MALKELLIYSFVEHYPNPFKPYLDDQFVQMIRDGHKIKIFSHGQYSSINENLIKFKLIELREFYPTSLRTVPNFFSKIALSLLLNPTIKIRILSKVYNNKKPIKINFMDMVRALLLPMDEPDICLIHNLRTATFFDFLSKIYRNSRVYLYFHGGSLPGMPELFGKENTFESVHLVFTNTEYGKRVCVEDGCKSDKIKILPVGLCLSEFDIDEQKRYRPNGILRIVFVGRLSKEKGVIFLLKALLLIRKKRIPFRCKIIGNGPDFYALYRFAKENKILDFVEFEGEMSRANIVNIYRNSDVLILPSIVTKECSEFQGLVVQEAMLMRLMVITTKVGGVQEGLPESMKMFSVDEKNEILISEKIEEIYNKDESELSFLGAVGSKFVKENYNISNLMHKILRA